MAATRFKQWQFLSRLLPYLRQYRSRVASGFICICFTNLFLLATPWVLKYAIDDLKAGVTRQKLLYYALTIIGLAVLEGIFRFAMRWLLIGVSRDVECGLRNDLFKRLEALPLSFYQRNKTGELMSRAT